MTSHSYKYSETEHERSGLNPCPFCAARSAVLIVQQISGLPEMDDVCFVRCLHCYAQGPATDDEGKAISRWNLNKIPINRIAKTNELMTGLLCECGHDYACHAPAPHHHCGECNCKRSRVQVADHNGVIIARLLEAAIIDH